MAGHARSPFTTRLLSVVVFMLLTFLLCYYIDNLKCKREKHTTFCFGQALECGEHEVGCEDLVENRADVQSGSACADKGTSTLLVHVVEAGPPLTRLAAGADIGLAQAIAESLSTRWNLSRHTEVPGARDAGVLFAAPYMARILNDTNMEPILRHLRSHSSVRFGYDAVRFATNSESSIENAVTAAVPSKINSFSLRTLFPNLESALEDVRKGSTGRNGDAGDNSGCNVFNLVLYIVLNVGQADRPASEAREALLTLRKTITRFLSRKKRYNKYLNSVWFVCLPTNGPSHFFREAAPPTPALPKLATAQEVRGVSTQLCAKHALTAEIQCKYTCSAYQAASSALANVSEALSVLFNASLLTTTRTIFVPYKECYNGMHTNQSAVREYFDDCTHLTRAGLARLGNCLLE